MPNDPRFGLHFRGGQPAFLAGTLPPGLKFNDMATPPVTVKQVAAEAAKQRDIRRRLAEKNAERELTAITAGIAGCA